MSEATVIQEQRTMQELIEQLRQEEERYRLLEEQRQQEELEEQQRIEQEQEQLQDSVKETRQFLAGVAVAATFCAYSCATIQQMKEGEVVESGESLMDIDKYAKGIALLTSDSDILPEAIRAQDELGVARDKLDRYNNISAMIQAASELPVINEALASAKEEIGEEITVENIQLFVDDMRGEMQLRQIDPDKEFELPDRTLGALEQAQAEGSSYVFIQEHDTDEQVEREPEQAEAYVSNDGYVNVYTEDGVINDKAIEQAERTEGIDINSERGVNEISETPLEETTSDKSKVGGNTKLEAAKTVGEKEIKQAGSEKEAKKREGVKDKKDKDRDGGIDR